MPCSTPRMQHAMQHTMSTLFMRCAFDLPVLASDTMLSHPFARCSTSYTVAQPRTLLQRPSLTLSQTRASKEVSISVGGQSQIKGATPELRDAWEETAFVLERLQVRPGGQEAGSRGE